MKTVLLLLCQGFEEFEASVFTDVLGWSRSYGLEGVSVQTVALRPEIRCTFNFIVQPQKMLEEIQVSDFDALAIPGGFEEMQFYEDAYDEKVLSLIRQFNEADKLIAAVCVAALALGKSGILRGRKATTYHMNDGVRRRQLSEFGVDVQDERLVKDGKIITCCGPAAAIDVAFQLLLELTTEANVQKVKEGMGFLPRMDADGRGWE